MDKSAFGIIALADMLWGTDEQLPLSLADPDGGPGLEHRRFFSHSVLYLGIISST